MDTDTQTGDTLKEEFEKKTEHSVLLRQGMVIGIGILLLTFLFIAGFDEKPQTSPPLVSLESVEKVSDTFDRLLLTAKAAYVFDIKKEKVLYALNEETQLPLASLTKLMTAIIAAETLPEKAVITIDEQAIGTEGDSGLLEEERWHFRDLLDFTLLTSSNDGARALAAAVSLADNSSLKREDEQKYFVDLMNRKARIIGLAQTYFVNETGLDTNESISGGYGSARDIAQLLEYAIRHVPGVIEVTRHKTRSFVSIDLIDHSASNTNAIAGDIPGLIGGKTGFTDLAGGNLAVAFDAGIGRPIIIVVLGSTEESRFHDVAQLMGAALETLN